jgi:hypothetical protein
MMTRVEQIWVDIESEPGPFGLFQRIDETHPLDLYAGLDHQGKRVLMLVSQNPPPSLPPPGVIELVCSQRADREFAIIIQLARQQYQEVFGRLCQDLVDSTRSARCETGASAMLARLGRWRKLLEIGKRSTLSEAALRGLIGELWFLRTVAIPMLGVEAGVSGWTGPLDTPQDFIIGDAVAEIKTCSPGSNKVTITSLQQLDSDVSPLYLGVVFLGPADATHGDAFSVAQLVQDIRESLEANHTASNEFDLRLADSGYIDDEEYERSWHRVTQTIFYKVEAAFPRLLRSHIATGIVEATYTIDLGACGSYESSLP